MIGTDRKECLMNLSIHLNKQPDKNCTELWIDSCVFCATLRFITAPFVLQSKRKTKSLGEGVVSSFLTVCFANQMRQQINALFEDQFISNVIMTKLHESIIQSAWKATFAIETIAFYASFYMTVYTKSTWIITLYGSIFEWVIVINFILNVFITLNFLR